MRVETWRARLNRRIARSLDQSDSQSRSCQQREKEHRPGFKQRELDQVMQQEEPQRKPDAG